MSYMVTPPVNLIAQSRTMSCWYASLRMLEDWRARKQNTAFNDPMSFSNMQSTFLGNDGLEWRVYTRVAQQMGLEPVSVSGNISLGLLEDMLYMSGPLWLDGMPIRWYSAETSRRGGHVVVLAGIQGEEIVIYDPAPVDRGSIWHVSINDLEAFLRDRANPNRPVNIMRYPARRQSTAA